VLLFYFSILFTLLVVFRRSSR